MSFVIGRQLISLLVVLAATATPARAAEETAYGKLLKAHVRPGTVSGIRLNLVDYRSIQADPSYPQALRDFASAKPESFPNDKERFAFWANAYNLMAIKAVIDQYPVKSIKDGGSLLRPIWKKPIGTVAGREYALDDIENGILRKDFKDPRVHFAIVCASLSCPDLRSEPYDGSRLDEQLDEAARAFLANSTKGLVPGNDGRTATVSPIFKWFRDDFAASGGAAAFIKTKVDPAVKANAAELSDAGLSYLDYDWSLNDTGRGGT